MLRKSKKRFYSLSVVGLFFIFIMITSSCQLFVEDPRFSFDDRESGLMSLAVDKIRVGSPAWTLCTNNWHGGSCGYSTSYPYPVYCTGGTQFEGGIDSFLGCPQRCHASATSGWCGYTDTTQVGTCYCVGDGRVCEKIGGTCVAESPSFDWADVVCHGDHPNFDAGLGSIGEYVNTQEALCPNPNQAYHCAVPAGSYYYDDYLDMIVEDPNDILYGCQIRYDGIVGISYERYYLYQDDNIYCSSGDKGIKATAINADNFCKHVHALWSYQVGFDSWCPYDEYGSPLDCTMGASYSINGPGTCSSSSPHEWLLYVDCKN